MQLFRKDGSEHKRLLAQLTVETRKTDSGTRKHRARSTEAPYPRPAAFPGSVSNMLLPSSAGYSTC